MAKVYGASNVSIGTYPDLFSAMQQLMYVQRDLAGVQIVENDAVWVCIEHVVDITFSGAYTRRATWCSANSKHVVTLSSDGVISIAEKSGD